MARNISLAAFDKKKELFNGRKNSEIGIGVSGGMKPSATVAVFPHHNKGSLTGKRPEPISL